MMHMDSAVSRTARVRGVDLRDLSSNLREYLRVVSAGETVLVTDCGRVVAQISAPHEGAGRPSGPSQPRVSLHESVAPGAVQPVPPAPAAPVLSLADVPAGAGVDGGAD